jgi:hypothetical protein
VTGEPVAETKEPVAGFWLWRVKSMHEAIEWVRRCPNPMPGESEIEIRPVLGLEDFAPCDPTGERRAADETPGRSRIGRDIVRRSSVLGA